MGIAEGGWKESVKDRGRRGVSNYNRRNLYIGYFARLCESLLKMKNGCGIISNGIL